MHVSPPPPRYPNSLKMPACKALDFAPDTEGLGSFEYAMANGNIPIYAYDLKNKEVRLCFVAVFVDTACS